MNKHIQSYSLKTRSIQQYDPSYTPQQKQPQKISQEPVFPWSEQMVQMRQRKSLEKTLNSIKIVE